MTPEGPDREREQLGVRYSDLQALEVVRMVIIAPGDHPDPEELVMSTESHARGLRRILGCIPSKPRTREKIVALACAMGFQHQAAPRR